MMRSNTNGQLRLDFSIHTYYSEKDKDVIYAGELEDKIMNKLYDKYKKFDDQYEEIRKNGGDLLTGRDVARYRALLGKNSLISRIGTYSKEGILSATPDDKAMIWTKESILTRSNVVLGRATDANSSSREYYPKRLDSYLSGLTEGKDYIVVSDFNPIDLLANNTDKRTRFLFGEETDNYFRFIVDNTNVRKIQVHKTPAIGSTFAKPKERFATQMYFSKIPQYSSDLMFIGEIVGQMHKPYPLFGLRSETHEETEDKEKDYVFTDRLF